MGGHGPSACRAGAPGKLVRLRLFRTGRALRRRGMGAWAVVGGGLQPLVSQGPEPGLMLRVCGSGVHRRVCVCEQHDGCAHGGSLPPCRAHGLAPGSHSRIWSSAAHRPPGTRTHCL